MKKELIRQAKYHLIFHGVLYAVLILCDILLRTVLNRNYNATLIVLIIATILIAVNFALYFTMKANREDGIEKGGYRIAFFLWSVFFLAFEILLFVLINKTGLFKPAGEDYSPWWIMLYFIVLTVKFVMTSAMFLLDSLICLVKFIASKAVEGQMKNDAKKDAERDANVAE